MTATEISEIVLNGTPETGLVIPETEEALDWNDFCHTQGIGKTILNTLQSYVRIHPISLSGIDLTQSKYVTRGGDMEKNVEEFSDEMGRIPLDDLELDRFVEDKKPFPVIDTEPVLLKQGVPGEWRMLEVAKVAGIVTFLLASVAAAGSYFAHATHPAKEPQKTAVTTQAPINMDYSLDRY